VHKPVQNIDEYYRHCPGEERVRISDAVCLGRRRSNYPKCKGCPFNDAERDVAESGGPSVPDRRSGRAEKARRDRVGAVFKSQDIRGAYPEPLDAEVAWGIGLATAQFLRSELRGYDRSQPDKSTVVVGRDMRPSSPELSGALIEGLRTGGSPVIDLGMIDTPQLYFAVNRLTCCGGVQVTASHHPAGFNGFRICGQKGKPIGAETGHGKIRKIARNTMRHTIAQKTPLTQRDLGEPYKQFVRGFLGRPGAGISADRPLKIVIDASNGMAGRWVPLLFGDLDWLEIVRLNFDHNGEFVHDPNPLAEANLVQLQDRMTRSKADLGACFDGDGDCLILVDNQGHAVRGDLVAALLARHLLKEAPGATVVHDARCSQVVPEEIRKAGGVPRRERCGHPYLKKALTDAKGVFGGELNGHYYFRDNWYCDSGMIALAQILNLLTESGRPLSELLAPLKRYAHSGERNFTCDNVNDTIARLAEKYGDAKIDYLDGITVKYKDWWFNVRPSSTEPLVRLNLEAKDEAMLKDKLQELCPQLGRPAE